MTIYIIMVIIVLVVYSLLTLGLVMYFKLRINELEIYGYHARAFIEKCGLEEEWNKVVDKIEKDM